MEDKMKKLNQFVSFMKKGEVYVFYLDFNFIFFTGPAAKLLKLLLEDLDQGKVIRSEIPNSFLNFLQSKRILVEVKDEPL